MKKINIFTLIGTALTVSLSGCVHADYLVVTEGVEKQFCARDNELGATVCYDEYPDCEKTYRASDDPRTCVARPNISYGTVKPENG